MKDTIKDYLFIFTYHIVYIKLINRWWHYIIKCIHISHSLYKTEFPEGFPLELRLIHISHSLYKTLCYRK